MKMTASDFEFLKSKLVPLDTVERRAAYKAQSTSSMGYRWFLLMRVAKVKIGDGAGAPGDIELYSYLNDDHIDTALRAIVPPLES